MRAEAKLVIDIELIINSSCLRLLLAIINLCLCYLVCMDLTLKSASNPVRDIHARFKVYYISFDTTLKRLYHWLMAWWFWSKFQFRGRILCYIKRVIAYKYVINPLVMRHRAAYWCLPRQWWQDLKWGSPNNRRCEILWGEINTRHSIQFNEHLCSPQNSLLSICATPPEKIYVCVCMCAHTLLFGSSFFFVAAGVLLSCHVPL